MSKFEKKEQNNSSTEEIFPKPPVYTKKRVFLSKVKRKILSRVWLSRSLFFASVIVLLSLLFFTFARLAKGAGIKNYLGLFGDFIFTPHSKVQNYEGRVNLLILGKSGEGNTAPDLTDTIIVASVSLKDPSVVLISVPRDLWIASIRAKINSAYYWGKQKQEGGGIVLAESLVEEVLGIPVHYAIVFDFSSFVEIIDLLGGVDVDVQRAFTDEKYPIAGRENDDCQGDREYKCRYETLVFEEGLTTMDGETALKFVRSRNAQGDEGTDLAREKRQQKVVAAVKSRVLSTDFLLRPKKVFEVWKVLKETVETDITESAAVILARKAWDSKENLSSHTIPERFLENPAVSSRYDNQYVFISSSGDWQEINDWVVTLLGLNHPGELVDPEDPPEIDGN